MRWMNQLLKGRSAGTAKDRLQIVIAQKRSAQPDFLPLLHKEILAVIEKYMSISSDMVEVVHDPGNKGRAVLKLNVVLPNNK